MKIESRIIDGVLEAVLVDKEEILLIFPKITSETGELQVKIPEFVINYMEMINEDKKTRYSTSISTNAKAKETN